MQRNTYMCAIPGACRMRVAQNYDLILNSFIIYFTILVMNLLIGYVLRSPYLSYHPLTTFAVSRDKFSPDILRPETRPNRHRRLDGA